MGNLVESAAQHGAHAEGIDLDPVAIDRGRRLGRNVHHRSVADQGGTWDRIVLNHVLEHVADLRGFLTNLDRLAAPGATITVNVPCYEGTIPRLMGDHWFGWAPDEHVWHFTPTTLRTVVESATSLRAMSSRRTGLIEPPSAGWKGLAKRIIGRTASRVNQGDQVAAVFAKQ